MDNPKWWHLAIATITIVLSGMLLLVTDIPFGRMLSAQAALAVFAICWFTFGRLAWRSPTAANVFTIVMIVVSGIAAALYPSMAIIQCVAYPIIWMISSTRRITIIANIALALSVGFGLAVGTGLTAEGIAQAAFIAALSLGFSFALGFWITSIFELNADKQRLIDELTAAQGQLAALHRDAGVSSERERLSRELHDTIAQSLTGLVMLVQGARRDLESGHQGKASDSLALIEERTRDALVETRALVAAGASVEVPGGIIPALHRLAERFERETGVTVTVEAVGMLALDRGSEVVLLRCTQEALSNVRKHAKAGAVSLSAHRSASLDGGYVELRVADDGVGFTPGDSEIGFGIAGMRDRLALVNGSLDVESDRSGTVLTARIPVAVSA